MTLGACGSSEEHSRALCIWSLETSKSVSGEHLVLSPHVYLWDWPCHLGTVPPTIPSVVLPRGAFLSPAPVVAPPSPESFLLTLVCLRS